ncbi:CCA tRNA nucleotidyltransferase, mitochondrial [Podochytrium sp. JEL0797]|nr:CCA tRNA nucleotidyltransferase, mitochondrial [Podochytrium sp. JEL0797]
MPRSSPLSQQRLHSLHFHPHAHGPNVRFAFRSSSTPVKPTKLLFDPMALDITTGHGTRWHAVDPNLQLTPTEDRICQLLVAVAKQINAQGHADKPPLTLRIAGGWVRDKLLGIDSHDLDIALDSLMGFEFAQKVNDFMKAELLEEEANCPTPVDQRDPKKKKLSSVAKIDSNPDKSKHLETATTKIYDQMIDFVNLRTETYNEDSRIPNMEFGTPTEDALRRDITINALFYNLHTNQVEDFTGQGLLDLTNGHIRTPLPPLQTFIDDPLRILRVIRFASRFNFSIEPVILDVCLQHPEIRTALGTKISKERIGVEVDKMLHTENVNNALRAVRLIHDDAGAAATAAAAATSPHTLLEQAISQVPVDLVAGLRVSEALTCLLEALTPKEMRDFVPVATGVPVPFSKEEIRLLFLCAMVTPYMGRMYLEKKKNVMPASKFVVMNSLKLSGMDGDYTSSMMVFIPEIQQTVDQIYTTTTTIGIPQFTSPTSSSEMDMDTDHPARPPLTRKSLGLFVRHLGTKTVYTACRPLGPKYVLAVFMAMVVEVAQKVSLFRPAAAEQEGAETTDDVVYAVLSKYRAFWYQVEQVHKVDMAWQLKPLLNGGEVSKVCGIRAGPAVGKVLQEMIEFQLENPEAGRDEVLEWLKGINI